MKKEDILREELLRMRQLMGMNGSLYQKPVMEHDEHGSDEPFGPGTKPPDQLKYKGGAKNPQYGKDFEHWREHNPPAPAPRPRPRPPAPPAPPPAPTPKKGAASTTGREGKAFTPKKGTSSKKIGDGQFVLPMASIPKFGGGKFGGNKFGSKAKSTTKKGKTKKTKKKEK